MGEYVVHTHLCNMLLEPINQHTCPILLQCVVSCQLLTVKHLHMLAYNPLSNTPAYHHTVMVRTNGHVVLKLLSHGTRPPGNVCGLYSVACVHNVLTIALNLTTCREKRHYCTNNSPYIDLEYSSHMQCSGPWASHFHHTSTYASHIHMHHTYIHRSAQQSTIAHELGHTIGNHHAGNGPGFCARTPQYKNNWWPCSDNNEYECALLVGSVSGCCFIVKMYSYLVCVCCGGVVVNTGCVCTIPYFSHSIPPTHT